MVQQSSDRSILFHEKTITDLKFHPDGDVFFASSKDSTASIINLEGKVLGSFEKHKGAISTIACSRNNLITAGLDMQVIQWDVITGNPLNLISSESLVRGLDFTDQIFVCTDNSMNKETFVGFIDPKTNEIHKLLILDDPTTRIFKYDNFLIVSTVSGNLYKVDLRNNQVIKKVKVHQSRIMDMKPSACRSFFVTCSNDSTALVVDSDTLEIKKKFDCEDPINSASIFSTNDKVVCVGGINARDVTLTQSKGSFDTNFFDIVTQKKVGFYSTHFGTINAVDVHPLCTHYISGGEDGSIHLVQMGDDFFKAPFTILEQ